MDLIRAKNKEIVYTFPFCFLLVEYILGMYVYWMLPEEYMFVDEVLALVLFAWTIMYAIRKKREPFDREVVVFTCIMLFYLAYSFLIRSNIPIAICSDFVVQIKPFVGYFMLIYIGFTLNETQKKIFKQLSLFLFFLTFALLLVNLSSYNLMGVLIRVFGHPTHYGTGLILIGFVYLFCSDLKNKKDVLIFVIILSFALLSTRSKIYGFYAVTVFFTLVMRGNINLKLSVRNVLILTILFPIVVYVAWTKINFYFVDFSEVEKESIARPMLYYTGWQLLFDYFPFGSGLASFSTHYSGVYYSPLYEKYGLDMVWGLKPESPDFVSDTHYPAIFGQFGIVGFLLFIFFWIWLVIKANKLKKITQDNKGYLLIALSVILIFIESVAGTFLTSSRGFFIMIFIALVLNEENYMTKLTTNHHENSPDK